MPKEVALRLEQGAVTSKATRSGGLRWSALFLLPMSCNALLGNESGRSNDAGTQSFGNTGGATRGGANPGGEAAGEAFAPPSHSGGSAARGGSGNTNSGEATARGGTTARGGASNINSGGASARGGAGGTPAVVDRSCPQGCAEISIPFSQFNTGQPFELYLPGPKDLSQAVISLRIRKIQGHAGGILLYAKNNEELAYSYAQTDWTGIATLTNAWAEIRLEVATPSTTGGDATFDPKRVHIISFDVLSGDAWWKDEAMTMLDSEALINPTVLQVDSVTISGAEVDPWNFETDAEALHLGTYQPIAGSTITWVGK